MPEWLKTVIETANNPLVYVPAIGILLFVGGRFVKWTKNKEDDEFWYDFIVPWLKKKRAAGQEKVQ